ncbi:hypothetical protein [Nocardia altamirensis]|uniref:hypothetical protein n=1 Tax=Nocardia altamirensis TaxID=472158 RepID=UPI00143557A6|nr:hypothetical protein [Nocardia altamirensis]
MTHVAGAGRPDDIETSEVRWIEPSELPGLDLHPVMRKRIADALDLAAATIA